MLKKQIFLQSKNAQTLQDKQYENIIDFEITSDLQFIIAYFKCSQIMIWKINSNKKESEIQARMGRITCLAISPNNKYFAVGGSEPSIIQVFEIQINTNSITLSHDCTNLKTINFSQDSKYLFTISENLILAIWNLQQQSFIKFIRLTNKQYFFSDLLNGPTIAQMFNKYSRRFALSSNTQKKDSQIRANRFSNIIIQIIPAGYKILTWHKKMIRGKKNIPQVTTAKFILDNKLLHFQLGNGAILFQTATMKSGSHFYDLDQGGTTKLMASGTKLMIVGFKGSEMKYWVF